MQGKSSKDDTVASGEDKRDDMIGWSVGEGSHTT